MAVGQPRNPSLAWMRWPPSVANGEAVALGWPGRVSCGRKLVHVNCFGARKAFVHLRGVPIATDIERAADVVLTDGAKTVTIHVTVPAGKR